MFDGGVENLQLISYERVHVADHAEFLFQEEAPLPFIPINEKCGEQSHQEVIEDDPAWTSNHDNVRGGGGYEDNQEREESQKKALMHTRNSGHWRCLPPRMILRCDSDSQ